MKHSQRKGSRSDDKKDENLRGKLREQEKIIKSLRMEIRYLQKQLLLTDDIEKDDLTVAPRSGTIKQCCLNCSSDRVSLVQIEKPGEVLNFLICKECHHREKISK